MAKGDETRERILDVAFRLASRDGLEGLSIGGLASEVGLSKGGLFAHFGSKEELQIAVLDAAAARFAERVSAPALTARRGVARLRKLFDLWLRWVSDPAVPGGCVFMAAAVELDDKPGRARDHLVTIEQGFVAALAKAARLAIESGELRKDVDCEQLAFEMYGVMASFSHSRRLLRDPNAEARARKAFAKLIAAAE